MENIRDWCVSRQLWWGHRIPAYYILLEGEVAAWRGARAECVCLIDFLVRQSGSGPRASHKSASWQEWGQSSQAATCKAAHRSADGLGRREGTVYCMHMCPRAAT